MMTATATPAKNWDKLLSEAGLPANELVRLLVAVYDVPQDEAETIVNNWQYADAT